MGGLVKGDIVVVLFPFSDLSSAKKRPALVLATPDGDDVILCQITSRLVSDRYAILIHEGDFSSGSLRQESNVRPARIFTTDTRIVQYVAGHLNDETMKAIINRVVEIIQEYPKKMEKNERETGNPLGFRSLVVVFSYHHNNTEKIANACAKVLGAEVKTPQQVKPEEIAEYDLVGFGSGIYSATFGASVLNLADRLPPEGRTKVFLFSTYGAPAFIANREFIEKNHSQIREKLKTKGYTIIGEFGCAGWNTNSFLKYFGGLNKGKPDAEDLRNAEAFARDMAQKARR